MGIIQPSQHSTANVTQVGAMFSLTLKLVNKEKGGSSLNWYAHEVA